MKDNPLTPFAKGEYFGVLKAVLSLSGVWLLVPSRRRSEKCSLCPADAADTASDIDIATLLPPGAMIYLESQDFLGQLQRWSDSGVKQRWLASANFSEFEKSRLYLRLKDRLQEFNSLAGLSTDLPLSVRSRESRPGWASTVFGIWNLFLRRRSRPVHLSRVLFSSNERATSSDPLKAERTLPAQDRMGPLRSPFAGLLSFRDSGEPAPHGVAQLRRGLVAGTAERRAAVSGEPDGAGPERRRLDVPQHGTRSGLALFPK